ncbi:helix-turn-helix domain-containing protein [Pedobacter boryungensis]|uniref:AraC family transcriptional regulator n=1 Tax=Pedobacter boryungensis TaxID=869962 RepID=A0ABX2DAK7_9SPHI|nr:helix-turn-helix domain-containing protein [Pedobacter boryungensis]NQX31097.1 AraC family transcriptional regulator [Pedobacter boryungensis]
MDAGAKYIAYPSINTPLAFFNQCKVEIGKELTIVEKEPGMGITSVLAGNFIKPVHISIGSGITEFSIVFKPIGINCLYSENIGKLLGNGLMEVNNFDFLKGTVAKILSGEFAFEELEELILEHFECTIELEKLEQIIKLLCMSEVISFQEISDRLRIPYKAIYRSFIRHLGISPIQFKKIRRFSMAIKKGVNPAYESRMSSIALESGYFDQAHYINEFKKMTKLTPRSFKLGVWTDENRRIVWKLE